MPEGKPTEEVPGEVPGELPRGFAGSVFEADFFASASASASASAAGAAPGGVNPGGGRFRVGAPNAMNASSISSSPGRAFRGIATTSFN